MNLIVSYGNGGNKLFLFLFVSWSPLCSRYNSAPVVRESATYAELAGLMGPADRELMDEDDTQSFEALELRLKTPMRPVPKSRVGANTPLNPVLKSMVDSKKGSKGTNETCPQVEGRCQYTPAETCSQVKDGFQGRFQIQRHQ
jgi:hypothetical protein